MLNPLASDATGNILVLTDTGRPVAGNEVHNRDTPPTLRFARRSSAKIVSSLQREDIHIILWPINKDFRSRNFTLISSLHLQLFHVGRQDSKPRYVLVKIFPQNQCYGSKKWRWLIQWTIKNLRAPFKETLISRISSCSTRGLGLLWVRSYRIPTLKRKSVWTNRKLKKKIGFFAVDRSLARSTITSWFLVYSSWLRWLVHSCSS